MSTHPEPASRIADKRPQVELVASLTEKTGQGKIPWLKQRNTISAALPDGLLLNAVLAFHKAERRPLLTAVEGLFEAVQRSTAGDLSKAIDSVKSL